MCQWTHGSHGSSKDVPLAALQAGPHVLPPEGSGLTCHRATERDRPRASSTLGRLLRRGCAVNTRSYFTDEETEPVSDPNLLSGQPGDRVYLSFKWCLDLGHPQTWASVLSDIQKEWRPLEQPQQSPCSINVLLLFWAGLPASHRRSSQGVNFPRAHISNFSN